MAISCIYASGAEEAAGSSQTVHLDPFANVNAFTQAAGGAPSVAANVLTIPGNSIATFGSLDWTDGTSATRFKWVTGGVPTAGWHVDRRALGGDYNAVYAWCDGINLLLQKHLFGGPFVVVGQVAAALVNNTQYWLQISSLGTTYTVSIFNDAAGAKGALLASYSAVIADAALQSGCAWLGTNTATAITWGGAFSGICTVAQITAGTWTVANDAADVGSGAWSSVNPRTGQRALALHSPSITAQPFWAGNGYGVSEGKFMPVSSSQLVTIVGQVKTLGCVFGGGGGVGYRIIEFTSGGAVVQDRGVAAATTTPTTNGFIQVSASFTTNPTTAFLCIRPEIYLASGDAWFDDFAVYVGTLPVQPTILRTGGAGGRSVAKFGGAALPNGQGVMQTIDLNDYVNTLLVDYLRSDDSNRQLGLEQLLYRARSAYVSDDFGPRPISLPMIYQDDATHFIGGFLAALSQAGEQQLTFDNLSYIAVKYKGITGRIPAKARQPLAWSFNLELLAAEPWFRDLVASTMAALTLTADAGQSFGVLNPGSIRVDDAIWTLVVPASNGVAINSMQLINTITGEALTVNFLSYAALPAATARIVTIDTGQSTVVDDAGHAYDVSGSFPKLHPPAGMVNPFNVILTPASGATAGLSLACSYVPRWQI